VKPLSIQSVTPHAALPGGEVTIEYSGLTLDGNSAPVVLFGDVAGQVLLASEKRMVAKVPEASSDQGSSSLRVAKNGSIATFECQVGKRLATNVHPVANPAVDTDGNVYVTYSNRRGQKSPVSIYKVTPKGAVTPFTTGIMNATGLAFGPDGELFVSSRHDGSIFTVDHSGEAQLYTEGMGIATGLAFDRSGNLYVGDRSGSIFKIGPGKEIFVFATIEPSVAAYHLAFGLDDHLYVSGPTTSSFDCIYRIAPNGEVSKFFTGLGRPQGIAVDIEGALYVACSHRGKRGIFRFRGGAPELIVAGAGLVGLAFDYDDNLLVCDSGSLYRVQIGITGKPLP
jgi:sugar lactone lactonase YvrE